MSCCKRKKIIERVVRNFKKEEKKLSEDEKENIKQDVVKKIIKNEKQNIYAELKEKDNFIIIFKKI